MSRKVLIVVREEAGVTYGRVVKASEQMLMQEFAHEHVEHVVRDKLMRNATQPEVAGFDYTLPGGMAFAVGEGHAVDVQGRSFGTLPSGEAVEVTIPAAHISLPRIDLVYATLAADSDGEVTPLPFRRQLTQAELEAGTDPYPISNSNVSTRRDNVAIIGVRQGTAASVPAAPAAGANEVPLYEVRVNAGVTAITADKVTDVRRLMVSLFDALARLVALEANPAITNLSEVVDDRVAVLIADSASLTRVYDDAGGLLTLDVDGAWLIEQIGDSVAALMVDSTYLTKNYNDAGGLLTLDVDIAAVGPALDPRFVNVTGDSMTGELQLDRGAAGVSIPGIHGATIQANGGVSPGQTVRGVVGIGRVSGTSGGDVGTCIGVHARGRHDGGPGNQSPVAYGVYAEVEQLGIPGTPSHYAVYGTTGGATGTNQFAGYFNGKMHVTGAFTAGSKNFVIDHPLDPTGKDLVHATAESNENLLLYRVTAVLVAGAASVDLDAALGLTSGTLARVAAALDVYGLHSTGPAHVGAEVVVGAEVDGVAPVTLVLGSADGADTSSVKVLLAGRRQDPYIFLDPWVGADGALVPEHDKAEGVGSGLSLIRVPVPDDDDLAGTAETKVDAPLAGRAGFPRHPAAAREGAAPAETLAYVPEAWQQVGPALPTVAANVGGVGLRAWTDTALLLTEDGSQAKADIGAFRSAATNHLVATGYGLSVPEGATVRAVVVEVRKTMRDSVGPFSVVSDSLVALVVGGAVLDGTNKGAEGVPWSNGYLQVTSYVFKDADLDGLVRGDFIASDFGVAVSALLEFNDEEESPICAAGVDTIRVTLFYE